MADKLQIRGGRIANTWRTNCKNVADELQECGKRIATTWRHSANTWQTDCNNATFKNKNHTFVTQKPPFCTSKTILLHRKNHTFVMRICNIQKTNTLRTFHKCVANTPKWVAKHSAIYPRTPTKLVANRLRMRCERIAKHC